MTKKDEPKEDSDKDIQGYSTLMDTSPCTAGLKRSQGQRFCHPKLFIILIYTCNEYHFLKFWPTDFKGWAHNMNIYDFGISSSEN